MPGPGDRRQDRTPGLRRGMRGSCAGEETGALRDEYKFAKGREGTQGL